MVTIDVQSGPHALVHRIQIRGKRLPFRRRNEVREIILAPRLCALRVQKLSLVETLTTHCRSATRPNGAPRSRECPAGVHFDSFSLPRLQNHR